MCLTKPIILSLIDCRLYVICAISLFSDCLGVLDCEWCVFDTDGTTRLSQPFCSTQRVCFAGVLEAVTPYHDEINGQ